MKKAVSVFSGLGGVDYGWRMSGLVEPAIAIEKDEAIPWMSEGFKYIHELNNPDCRFLLNTIQQQAANGFTDIPDDIYWIHGSHVCSNFSDMARMNQRQTRQKPEKAISGDMSSAIAFTQLIEAKQPTVVTIENAPGYRDSEEFKSLRRSLLRNGYNVVVETINMGDYGVPMHRERLFAIATKSHIPTWRFPAMQRPISWFEALVPGANPDIFEPLDPDAQSPKLFVEGELTDSQAERLSMYLGKHAASWILSERVNVKSKTPKLCQAWEPCFSVTKMSFIGISGKGEYASRYRFLTAFNSRTNKAYALTLRAAARLFSFPDEFNLGEYYDTPVIAGAGFGQCVPPKFIELLTRTNLS